jgi:hypothetical protein
MTTMVDRLNQAADGIRDDDFLADKKRVTSFFFVVLSILRRR